MVTADSKVLTASASDNGDLFWALRGGGRLLLYPRNAAFDVIRHFRDYIETAPDELTGYAGLLHGPDGVPVN